LVELLAALSGNHLRVLPMNSATDTTELLGGFEQVFPTRIIIVDLHSFSGLCLQCMSHCWLSEWNGIRREKNLLHALYVTIIASFPLLPRHTFSGNAFCDFTFIAMLEK